MTFRQEKIGSLIREMAASFIKSEISSRAIISVTRVEVSLDLKTAKIFITVFPESKEKEIMDLLKNKTGELRKYSKNFIKIKFLPSFEIAIDQGEKNRQRIEEILKMAMW